MTHQNYERMTRVFGVGLRVSVDSGTIQFVTGVRRKWWQLRKPKVTTHVLAEKELYRPLAKGTGIRFETYGGRYFARIDDDIVLQWSLDDEQ